MLDNARQHGKDVRQHGKDQGPQSLPKSRGDGAGQVMWKHSFLKLFFFF